MGHRESHEGLVHYADNPGVNSDVLKKLADLAAADVPVLHVCGSIDPLLGRVSTAIENIYQQFGGRISVMIKEGAGHHPHISRPQANRGLHIGTGSASRYRMPSI